MKQTLFGTDGVRGVMGQEPLDAQTVRKLARAIGEYFGGGKKILLGRDTRASSEELRAEVVRGLSGAKNEVRDLGVLPTPALASLTSADTKVAGAVMITASHNPENYNGIKILGEDGEKLNDEEEQKIEEMVAAMSEVARSSKEGLGECAVAATERVVDEYVRLLKDKLGDLKFGGQKVVMDAAAGAGHEFNRRVLETLGATVVMVDPEPDGHNINAECGALCPEKVAMRARAEACIGMAFDGDADRVILADEEGRIWNGDRIVALIAEALLAEGRLKNDAVVLTEYSNYAVIKYLQAHGVRVEKVEVGDRAVAEKLIELDAMLGGEVAGHIIYRPWRLNSDGVFVAAMVLGICRRKNCRLADLWAEFKEMEMRQWGVAVRERRELAKVAGFSEALARAQEELSGTGRVFVRYSGTENKLRILVEAEQAEMVERIGETLAKIIRKELGE